MARCVLPTPGGPRISSDCFSRIQPQLASVSIRLRSTDGWKLKSKPEIVCPVGSPESFSDVRMRRSSRWLRSCSSSRPRRPGPLSSAFGGVGEQVAEGGRGEVQAEARELGAEPFDVRRRLAGRQCLLAAHRVTSASSA